VVPTASSKWDRPCQNDSLGSHAEGLLRGVVVSRTQKTHGSLRNAHRGYRRGKFSRSDYYRANLTEW
jgi:hypothetical protein